MPRNWALGPPREEVLMAGEGCLGLWRSAESPLLGVTPVRETVLLGPFFALFGVVAEGSALSNTSLP